MSDKPIGFLTVKAKLREETRTMSDTLCPARRDRRRCRDHSRRSSPRLVRVIFVAACRAGVRRPYARRRRASSRARALFFAEAGASLARSATGETVGCVIVRAEEDESLFGPARRRCQRARAGACPAPGRGVRGDEGAASPRSLAACGWAVSARRADREPENYFASLGYVGISRRGPMRGFDFSPRPRSNMRKGTLR